MTESIPIFYAWRIKKNADEQRNWTNCKAKSIMAIDGRGLSDFLEYDNLEGIREAYRNIYKSNTRSNARVYPDACWQFSNLEECQIVIAFQEDGAVSNILAYGTVEDEYSYNIEYGKYPHTVPIKWNQVEGKSLHERILNPKVFFGPIKGALEDKIKELLGLESENL